MRKATTAAILLFAVLSLLLTYPLALHLPDAVEDRQDALLNVWITAWDGHQLLSDPLHLFDANIFYPYPRTLAYSELLLGNGLLALPVLAISGNPILSYNLLLLVSFFLSGLGTYLLVLRLTRSWAAGLVAGTVFAFSSYRLSNLAQAQLLATQWIPLALLSLDLLLHHPRLRHVVTFVLFFSLQALSSFYYAILLALAAVGFVLWSFVAPGGPSSRSRRTLVCLAVAAVCCALVILPFALPYFQVQRDLGFERTLSDNEPFSASLRQYLMVPPGSVVHGRWLPSDDAPRSGGYPVDALFPGLIALALAVWGLVRGRGRTRWFFLLLILASFLLSLGPRLFLAPGQPADLGVHLPYAWLYAWVPGFKALRAPVRFDALVMLGLAVLAGYGVAALPEPRTQAARTWWWAGITAALALFVVLESWVCPAARAESIPVGGEVPAVYRWLEGQHGAPILELPMAFAAGGPQLDYQYYSAYHWRTTPDGYSGFIPPKRGQIAYEMERFPSERSISLLQALDVMQLVIHADRYPALHWREIEKALAQADELVLEEMFGDDLVYRVQRHDFDPDGLQVTAHLPSRVEAGQPYTAHVIAVNRGSRSYALPPTARIHPAARWQSGRVALGETVSADVPLVTSPRGGAAVIPVLLTAPEEPAAYRLVLGEQGGPLGTWEAAGDVLVVEPGGGGEADFPVPARLVSWNLPPAVRAGETLTAELAWKALGKIDAYYSVYVKLVGHDGNAIAGWDGEPQAGSASTLLWVPGEIVADTVVLKVPPDAPPGDYSVEVGMYRASDLARSLTLNADGSPVERIVLGNVRVLP